MNTMQIRFQISACRAAFAMALAVALLLGLCKETSADATSYAGDRRQVRACVLVSSASANASGKENRVPYVFYVMDRRADLKPNGWEFVNPLASATITGDTYLRWKTRGGAVDPAFQVGTPQATVFQVGAPLSKNMGAYWEVDLDAIASDDLQQFDVVLIASRNIMTFNSDERDKLRRFADSGGTIWLEDEGGANISGAGPFVTDVSFDVALPAGTPQLNTSHHPLVNFPFGLTGADAQFLGLGAAGLTHHSHRDQVHNQLVSPHYVAPIVLQGPVPLISAGDFGAGHLVISSAGIATGINSFVGGVDVVGGNSGAISGEVMLGVLPSDIKFAYNLVAWTSSIPTHGVSTRRSGGTRENIGSDLGRKWQTLPITTANTGVGSGAVIHKGVAFWVDGNNVLHAYDASPEQDLDGDQNSDDGIPDLLLGTPYDEIWNVDLKTLNIGAGTRVSTPTIVSANSSLTAPNPVDIVTVTASNGITVAFNAFPRNAAGRLQTTSPVLWSVSATTNLDVGSQMVDGHNPAFNIPGPSPAFSEGILFTIVNDPASSAANPWRVVAVNPLTGTSVFDNSGITGGVSNTAGVAPTDQFNNVPGLSSVVGPINVGYVRDQATGALDKMVYVPTGPFNNGMAAIGPGQVVGCWFGTKQEPMQSIDGTPGNVDHTRFRAAGERGRIPWFLPNGPLNGIDLRPVIYVNTAAGNVLRLTLGTDFTVTYEGAVPNRELIVTLNNPLTDIDKVFADYTVDWSDSVITPAGNPAGQPNTPQAQEMQRFVSRRFSVPAPIPNTNFLIAGTAMTPEDLMVVNSSDFPGFDKVYAVRDQYPATALGPAARSAKVSWAWGPNGPSDTTNPLDPDSQVGINGLRPRLINSDPWLPETGGPAIFAPLVVTDLELIGSPAVSNGVIYEVAYCHMKDGGGAGTTEFNAAVIMALRSNPNNTFTINQNGSPIKFDTTTTAGQPLVTLEQLDLVNSRPGNPRYIQLFENVNFTVDRISSSVTITDFRSANNGDTFNAAMPIFVRVGATRLTDPIVNANTGFGPLDNLLWWAVMPIAAPPVVGLKPDAAQVSQDIMPSSGVTAVGDTLYFGTAGGSIASFDLTGIQNNGGQAKIYRADGTLRIHSQPVIIDPATGNTPIANNAIFSPPLATAGIVVAGTPRGLLALDNQVTLIADNNRLIEVDRGGRAVHSIDATQAVSIAGGATIVAPDTGQIVNTRIPLDRPSIARRTGLNEYLVCDTGNNRIVQMGHGGLVTWELHSVSNDLRFLRPGDPLTLSAPSDVQTYTDSSQNGPISITNPTTGVTYTRPAGYFFATHYIVADSGNFRGLEIVDMVDQTNTPLTLSGSDGSTVRMLRQVVFVTRSLGEQNRNIRYRTMQQFTDQNNLTFMVSAVDNLKLAALDPTTRPVGATSADTQGPGAGIMVIKRFPPAGQVDGDVAAVISSFGFLDANGKVAVDAKGNVLRHSISNPTYFREFEDATFVGGSITTVTKYLLADSSGVYQLRPSANTDQTQGGKPLAGREALVEWMITSDDYFRMTGRPLRAMSVQKLQQADPFVSGATVIFKPHYLITNGYSGLDSVGQVFGDPNVLPGELHGEVFEVKGLDYYLHTTNGFYDGYKQAAARRYGPNGGVLTTNINSSIVWLVPNETLPGRDVNNNVLQRAIRRTIGLTDGGTATYLLEQPTSASRPF